MMMCLGAGLFYSLSWYNTLLSLLNPEAYALQFWKFFLKYFFDNYYSYFCLSGTNISHILNLLDLIIKCS